jgi:hypothetical protein
MNRRAAAARPAPARSRDQTLARSTPSHFLPAA